MSSRKRVGLISVIFSAAQVFALGAVAQTMPGAQRAKLPA